MSYKHIHFNKLRGIGRKYIDSMTYKNLYTFYNERISSDYDDIKDYTTKDGEIGISKESYINLQDYIRFKLDDVDTTLSNVYTIEVPEIESYNNLFTMVRNSKDYVDGINNLKNMAENGHSVDSLILKMNELINEDEIKNNVRFIHNKRYNDYKKYLSGVFKSIDTDGNLKSILNHSFIEIDIHFSITYTQKDIDNIIKPFKDCLFFYANACDNNVKNIKINTKVRRSKSKQESISFRARRLKHSEYKSDDLFIN